MVVVALALIGGTGCISTMIQNQRGAAAYRTSWDEKVAALEAKSARGDMNARVGLALQLTSNYAGTSQFPRGVALLKEAVQENNPWAEFILGRIMVRGAGIGGYAETSKPFRDVERGWELLRRAASQSCRYSIGHRTESSTDVFAGLFSDDRVMIKPAPEETALWRARGVLHCGFPSPDAMYWRFTSESKNPAAQTEELALLMLLPPRSSELAKAQSLASADMLEAARLRSTALRRMVDESLARYSAPTLKEWK